MTTSQKNSETIKKEYEIEENVVIDDIKEFLQQLIRINIVSSEFYEKLLKEL